MPVYLSPIVSVHQALFPLPLLQRTPPFPLRLSSLSAPSLQFGEGYQSQDSGEWAWNPGLAIVTHSGQSTGPSQDKQKYSLGYFYLWNGNKDGENSLLLQIPKLTWYRHEAVLTPGPRASPLNTHTLFTTGRDRRERGEHTQNYEEKQKV